MSLSRRPGNARATVACAPGEAGGQAAHRAVARRRDEDIAPYRNGAGAMARDHGGGAVRTTTGEGRWHAATGQGRCARPQGTERGKGAQGDGAGQRGVSGWQVSQDLRSLILRSGISLLFN